jgi:hypothetical protein
MSTRTQSELTLGFKSSTAMNNITLTPTLTLTPTVGSRIRLITRLKKSVLLGEVDQRAKTQAGGRKLINRPLVSNKCV